jgi:cell division transport system permease protein
MFKALNQLDYLLRETFLGLRRGGWMNWAAVSTVTVLLFLFGLGLQASWQVDSLLGRFGSQLEVSVYLDTGVKATVLAPVVKEIAGVARVTTTSKEQAWAALVQDLGIADIQGATAQLNGNPLVDEMRVQVVDSQQVPQVADRLRKLQGVRHVQYVDEAVRQIADLQTGLTWLSGTVTTVLTLTAIAVITTTIRLIVVARRREIEIMQLVGATYHWIYLPFVLQGVVFGVLGGAIAWSLLSGLSYGVGKNLAQQPEFIRFLAEGLALGQQEQLLMPIVLLGFGAGVGLLGSLFAVRRFATR